MRRLTTRASATTNMRALSANLYGSTRGLPPTGNVDISNKNQARAWCGAGQLKKIFFVQKNFAIHVFETKTRSAGARRLFCAGIFLF